MLGAIDNNENDRMFEVRAPTPVADIEPIDLVACPNCGAVLSLDGIDGVEEKRKGRKRVRGVFCRNPGCGQLLYDEPAFTEHMVERAAEKRADELIQERELEERAAELLEPELEEAGAAGD